MKILVADDDPLYCRVPESALARWGYEVNLVNDGEAVLKALMADEGPKADIYALLQAADAALYRAKNNSRDRVELGRGKMPPPPAVGRRRRLQPPREGIIP